MPKSERTVSSFALKRSPSEPQPNFEEEEELQFVLLFFHEEIRAFQNETVRTFQRASSGTALKAQYFSLCFPCTVLILFLSSSLKKVFFSDFRSKPWSAALTLRLVCHPGAARATYNIHMMIMLVCLSRASRASRASGARVGLGRRGDELHALVLLVLLRPCKSTFTCVCTCMVYACTCTCTF